MFHFSKQGLIGREARLERFFEILPGFTSWVIIIGMFALSFLSPILAAIIVIAFDFYWLLRMFDMIIFLVLSYFRLSVEKETDWMARVGEIDKLCNQLSLRGNNPGKAEAISPTVILSPEGTKNLDPSAVRQAHRPEQSRRTSPQDDATRQIASPRSAGFAMTAEGSRRAPRNDDMGFKKRISLWVHARQLKRLKRSGTLPPPSSQIYHLVIFSVAEELPEVIEPGIRALQRQAAFPSERLLIAVALEQRAQERVKEGISKLQEKYRNSFFDFLVFQHPDHLPGEARVKGANATYAAKQVAKYFEEKEIPFEQVVVSCFDADTVVDEHYIAALTYHFMVCPRRNRASFQPIPVYHNNIWEASAFARVLDIGSSFFQLIEATNPERLVTFSSHSMSFKALVDVGYWPVDMISDDSAIFWKALIHFDGDYRVVPMYVTLSMDVVSGESWWKSIVNVYRQKRRWAWGVENFPIVMRAFLKADKIPLLGRLKYAFKLFEDSVAWATWPILLTVIGWLPAIFAGREFSDSVLYYSAPRITGLIFNLASLALVASIVLGLLLLPKKGGRWGWAARLFFTFEWLLVPFIVVFLSAIPALDAQTRLMLGKYMEFWVSEKKAPSANPYPSSHADPS